MQITIVGLGLVGTSLALALKAASPEMIITGHDPNGDNLKRAKDLKAIDKTHWNLISACDKAEVILLDLSTAETEKTIKALGANLERPVLIMDTSAVKRPVMALAAKHLPESVSFIGAHLVSTTLLPSTTEPSADLPKDATLFLVAPEKVSAQTVNLATTLAEAVGANPRFIDADEHDGLMAATFGLPLAGALATFGAVSEPAGLQDRARGMGAELYNLGALLGETPEDTADLARANADLLIPWIDIYIERLNELRDALANNDRDALDKLTTKVHETLVLFLRRGEERKSPIPDAGLGLRQMFLGGLGGRKSN